MSTSRRTTGRRIATIWSRAFRSATSCPDKDLSRKIFVCWQHAAVQRPPPPLLQIEQSPRTSSTLTTMDLADCTLRQIPSELGHVRSIEVGPFFFFFFFSSSFFASTCLNLLTWAVHMHGLDPQSCVEPWPRPLPLRTVASNVTSICGSHAVPRPVPLVLPRAPYDLSSSGSRSGCRRVDCGVQSENNNKCSQIKRSGTWSGWQWG